MAEATEEPPLLSLVFSPGIFHKWIVTSTAVSVEGGGRRTVSMRSGRKRERERERKYCIITKILELIIIASRETRPEGIAINKEDA